MRSRLFPPALLALGFLVTPVLADDEPKGDLAKLQGRWSAKAGPDKDIPITLTIKGSAVDLLVSRPDGEEFKLKGEIKLDEKADPKTMDWVKFTGPNGDDLPANLGLYKIDGDTWTVCSGGPGNDRPSKFAAGEGGPPNLTAWTRVKPAEKAPEGDLAKFQGAWSAKVAGADIDINLEIKGNAVTAKWSRGDGNEIDIRGEIRINEKAGPKTVDFFGFKSAAGEPMKDNLGVYEIDGDSIKICNGGPGNERPTELKAGEGGPPTLLLLSRKKKD